MTRASGTEAAAHGALLPGLSRTGWLIALSIAAVAAVNVAGVHGIATARHAAREAAEGQLAAETRVRARAIERVLADTRANLSFLAASSALGQVDSLSGALSRSEREAAEGALLVFLRGHAEVVRLSVRSPRGPLLLVGRRGGVPVLWVATQPTGEEGAAIDPTRPRLTTRVDMPAGEGAVGPLRLEAEVAGTLLLAHGDFPARTCRLSSGDGTLLARRTPPGPPDEDPLSTSGELSAEGWSPHSPWSLACDGPAAVGGTLVEPLATRYRATLVLNLAAMLFALLLGALAVRESARRERVEARALAEGRVRELERQLFHAERLTTVGRFAAGIAHEINNPLEGIANYLCLAREELARGSVQAAERHLAGVEQGLERAAGIVRQVLAHADPATAPHTPIDLNPLLAQAAEFVRSRREFAGVRLETELADGPLLTLGSAIMLGQVASNLVINACEAQPGGGQVCVRSERAPGQVLVEVADRGPGVAEADRERIFEPFFSTKDSTGLGLSICHSIVRAHAGRLEVLPRSGGGATFRMTLPACEPGAKP